MLSAPALSRKVSSNYPASSYIRLCFKEDIASAAFGGLDSLGPRDLGDRGVEEFVYDFETEVGAIEEVEVALEEEKMRRDKIEKSLKEFEERKEEETVRDVRPLEEKSVLYLKSLDSEVKAKFIEFQFASGLEDVFTVREILEGFEWDFSKALSYFFEMNGDLDKLRDSFSIQKETSTKDSSLLIVYPDLSKETQVFDKTQTMWQVYSFIALQAHKWENRPFMIGNSERLFKEEELDHTVEEVGLYPKGNVFVKKY